jgi:DNA-binding MarR family transcriptional regulator
MTNLQMANDEPAQRLAEELSYLSGSYLRWCEESAQEDDLSYARLWLLGTLWMFGSMNMSALGKELGVTRRTVTALVDGLEADDLVERQSVPGDRRVNLIVLTPKAKRSTGRRLRSLLTKMSSAFSDMSDADLEQALDLISRLRTAVDEAREAGPPA